MCIPGRRRSPEPVHGFFGAVRNPIAHTALQYSPKEAFELLMLLDFLTIMLAAAAPLKNATLT
jgi:hypothetical protein